MKIFGQLEKAQIENVTSDSAGQPAGLIVYRTDQLKTKISTGTVMKELIDEDTAQTLVNKTMTSPSLTNPTATNPIITGPIQLNEIATPATPAAGLHKFYYKLDGFLYTLDSTGNEVKVGSGGAGGGVDNLITNGSAEDILTSIFVPYKDAASTRPVDGIGGSPSVTTSLSSVNPLVKVKSFILTKPASNCQGEGWSISDIALPLAYRGKSLKDFLEYILNSGTFVPGNNSGTPTDGDAIVYFYDQTNAKLMEPSNIKFFGSSVVISDKYESTVQFDINCTQVRMIIHVASTSALAWELKVDNVTLSPQNYVYGTPVTDFVLPIVHTSNITTNATLTTKTRRVGDSYHVVGNIFFSGANTQAVTPTIFLPYTLDTSKLPANGTIAVGQYSIQNAGSGAVSNGSIVARLPSFGTQAVVFEGVAPNANVPFAIAANHSFGFEFSVPVLGVSSSTQMSDGYDGRNIMLKATLSANQVVGFNVQTKILFDTVAFDDVNGFSSGTYTVKTAGRYRISGHLSSTTSAGTGELVPYLRVNGSDVEAKPITKSGTASQPAQGSYEFVRDFKVGDTIEIWLFQNINNPLSLRSNVVVFGITSIEIEKIQGSQTISVGEKQLVWARNSSGKNLPISTNVVIDGWTGITNTHGQFNPTTGIFTASEAVSIEATAGMTINDAFGNGSRYFQIYDITNAVILAENIKPYNVLGGGQETQLVTAQIDLKAGQQIAVRGFQDSTGALTLVANAQRNWLSIKRVG